MATEDSGSETWVAQLEAARNEPSLLRWMVATRIASRPKALLARALRHAMIARATPCRRASGCTTSECRSANGVDRPRITRSSMPTRPRPTSPAPSSRSTTTPDSRPPYVRATVRIHLEDRSEPDHPGIGAVVEQAADGRSVVRGQLPEVVSARKVAGDGRSSRVRGLANGLDRRQRAADRGRQVVDVGLRRDRGDGAHPARSEVEALPAAGRGTASDRRRRPSRRPSRPPRRTPGRASRRRRSGRRCRRVGQRRGRPGRASRAPRSSSRSYVAGVSSRSVASPAAAATGLPLNVPPWLTAPGRRASKIAMTSARPPKAASG